MEIQGSMIFFFGQRNFWVYLLFFVVAVVPCSRSATGID